MDDAPAPFGPPVEQGAVGVQTADDVLGEFRTVHPHDRLPSGAHLLPQRRHPLVHVRLVGAAAQEVGVGAEAVHPDPGVAGAAEDLRTAADERVRPAAGQEGRPVGAEDAVEELFGDVVGQQPEVVDGRPRGVREVADPQVGAELAEHAGHQRQVVVLYEDRRTLARLLGERRGEGPVVRLEGGPLAAELRVEDGLDGGLVEQVVDEPEHRVGDAVVRVGVHLRVDVEHPDTRFADAAPHRLAVTVPEGGADPHLVVHGAQSGDESAPAAPRVEGAVLPQRVRDRAAVGRDEDLGSGLRGVLGDHGRNLARSRSVQTCEVGRCHAARRERYSSISRIGGRSSVSTAYVRGTNPCSPRSNCVSDGRTRCPLESRSWAVR